MSLFEAIEEFFNTLLGRTKPQPIRIETETETEIARLRRLQAESLSQRDYS
jgi:hypothetical protein